MSRVHQLHQVIIKQPGFFGKVYGLCCNAVASTAEAVDLELRLSNSSSYSQIRLAWDVWVILDTLVLPSIVRKISSWSSDVRLGLPQPKAQTAEAPKKLEVTKAEAKIEPGSELHETSFTKEDTVLFSSDPNLDLPLPTGNPSMTDLCTYYNDHVEPGPKTKLDKAQTFCSSTDCLLDWSYDETPKEKVNWKEIISASGSQDGSGSDVEVLDRDVLAELDQSYPSRKVTTVTEISQLEFSQVDQDGSSFFYRDLSISVPEKVYPGEPVLPVFEELGKCITSVEDSEVKTDETLIELEVVQDEVAVCKEAAPLKLNESDKLHEVETQHTETVNTNSCRKETRDEIFFATPAKIVPEPEILQTDDPSLFKDEKVICSTGNESKINAAAIETTPSASVDNDVVIESSPVKSKASVPDQEAERSYTEMYFDEESDDGSSPDDGSTDESDEIFVSFRDVPKEQPLNVQEEPVQADQEQSFHQMIKDDTILESLILETEFEPAATCSGITEETNNRETVQTGEAKIGQTENDPENETDEVKLFTELFLKCDRLRNETSDETGSQKSGSSDSAFADNPGSCKSPDPTESQHDLSSSSIPALEFSFEDDDDEQQVRKDQVDILEENLESGHFSLTLMDITDMVNKDEPEHKLTIDLGIDHHDNLTMDETDGKMFTDWTSSMVQNFEQSSSEIVTISSLPAVEEVERQNCDEVDGAAGVVDVDADDSSDHGRVRNEASKHHELMFASGLETLFEEDGAGELGGRVVEDDVWQKAIHIPIPDMSPPLSPVQTVCSCCDQDQDKPVECRNKTEEVYSEPEVDDDTRSRTDTLHLNDFSPSTRSSKRSISGYFRRKLSKLRKSSSKLDVSHESSDDLTVKSKWKKSHGDLTFSDSWNQTSPDSSLSGSLARSAANKTWSGSSLSFFSKRKRGKLSISDFRHDHQHHHVVDESFAEELPQSPTLSKWQKSASISNLPEPSDSSFIPMMPKTTSGLSAKSMSDISDLSHVSGLDGTKSR